MMDCTCNCVGSVAPPTQEVGDAVVGGVVTDIIVCCPSLVWSNSSSGGQSNFHCEWTFLRNRVALFWVRSFQSLE